MGVKGPLSLASGLHAIALAASVSLRSPTQPDGYAADWPCQREHCPRSDQPLCQMWDESAAPGYDINTNYYLEGPDTGKVVEYTFEVDHAVIAPDGVQRDAILANGQFPGPLIEASWGDTVVVHVTNRMNDQGTGIHFHGIRQNWTNPMDGVPSITQCPIAPGDTFTYVWKATQYGTSWWHSHYQLQQFDGLNGGIVIHGPASSSYDGDAGMVLLTDWGHETAQSLFPKAESSMEPVKLENGLINGRNPLSNSSAPYYEALVQTGKKYRFRVVNTALNSMFKFSIDQHTLTVIAADLNPIKPYNATWINIGIGERYDVVVSADQDPGDFWIRSIPQARCSAILNQDIKGILRYDAASSSLPRSVAYDTPMDCDDEQVTPFLELDVGEAVERPVVSWDLRLSDSKLIRWFLQDKYWMQVEWNDPTLLQIDRNVSKWSGTEGVVQLNSVDQWVVLVIQNTDQIIHPMHLHGHDFYVLATSPPNTTYTEGEDSGFKLSVPPRRDSIMLPPGGYLAVAFLADNPGAWLFHCHIGWHLSEGMALQFVEQYGYIEGMTRQQGDLASQCARWSAFQNAIGLQANDSGV